MSLGSLQSLRAAICLLLVIRGSLIGEASAEPTPEHTHPLMPGIRCADLNNRDWPRTLHDRIATGFSPLICGMSEPPEIWSRVPVGGQMAVVETLQGSAAHVLVRDTSMRLVRADGHVEWQSQQSGEAIFWGNLHVTQPSENLPQPTHPAPHLLLASGNRLVLLNGHSGEEIWSHSFEPQFVQARAQVADVLPDRPGLEVAVVLQYGREACLFGFSPRQDPELLWQSDVLGADEFDERYDHHCSLRIDLSTPHAPMIWNLRRHRCHGIDPTNGRVVSSVTYQIGGQNRRNYGTWDLAFGRDGRRFACVLAESVQLHVHGIELNRSTPCRLAWQHYYGEVYKEAPGVALKALAIADLDGDQSTEVVYAVRDPARDLRTFVRVRDAESGRIEAELADTWGVAVLQGDEPMAWALIACHDPQDIMREQGLLSVYQFRENKLLELKRFPRSEIWGTVPLDVRRGELLVREHGDKPENAIVRRYRIGANELLSDGDSRDLALLSAPVQAVLEMESGRPVYVVPHADGRVEGRAWNGERIWALDVMGGPPPSLSAADWDGDGRAELFAATASGRARVYSFDDAGGSVLRTDIPYQKAATSYSPLLEDLNHEGKPLLLAPDVDDDGTLVLRAERHDGTCLWQARTGVLGQDTSVVLNSGRFLPGGQHAVALSFSDNRRTAEGTILLEGVTGRELWRKDRYRDGEIMMPVRPHGVPTAWDWDQDGSEEIGIDMLSYMAFLSGSDGRFVHVLPTRNIRAQGATYAGHLNNTFCPVFLAPRDTKPHWLVKGGFGPFGLMKPDPREGIWRVDLAYDGPPHMGMVDVDGDGQLEVGYAALGSEQFVCRDLATGRIEWQLALPRPPGGAAITADVDGDRKGEFLVGPYCIGTDGSGRGVLRWTSPVRMDGAVVADLDGDGVGEIACPAAGEAVVLKARDGRVH